MNRRTFLCGLTLGTVFAPLASEAQRPGNVPRVGVLFEITPVADMIGSEPKNVAIGAFLRGLRELGYIKGQNVVIDRRSDEGTGERLPALAAELVRLNVDVILAGTERVVQAAMEATSTIPIVAPALAAPVERAFAKSLARPGGNVTGLTSSGRAIDGKRLQLLKEAAPTITYVAFLHLTSASSQLGELSTAARVLRVTLLPAIVDRPGQFTNAFAVIGRKRADALLAGTNVLTYLHRRLIVDFAARSQLPAMSGFREFADAGGLMSYGPSIPDQFRRAATYVDRILKGAKPGDLPIEQPTKFELVINLKTAKALGLTIPPSLLVRADQVIE